MITYLLINDNYTKGRVGNTITFSYSFSEAEFLLAYFFPFIFASQHSFLCYTFRALNYAKFPIIFHDSCRNYYWNSRAQPSQMIISNASKNSQSFEGHLESKSNVGNSRENWLLITSLIKQKIFSVENSFLVFQV